MNITIAGHKRAEQILAARPQEYNVVFINSPRIALYDFVPQYAKDYIYLQFDDITFDRGDKFQSPKKEDVQKALDWTATRDEPFLIVCAAGISRSSSIAYLVTYSKTKNIDAALGILDPELHVPNIRIVKYGSEIFNDPEVHIRCLEWINNKSIGDEVPLEIA